MGKVNKSSNIVLFQLNPFISAIMSLRNIRDGYSHKFLYAWFIIFGIAFCAVNEAADSYRYVERFNIESGYTASQYWANVKEWSSFDSEIKDIYTLTVNFLVGQFTHNYHWTFFIYAIVFGFFYIKSLKVFLNFSKKNDLLFYVLLFLFCFSNPIFNINGVRFWTAAWIGVFVALKIFVEKQNLYLPLLVLMPIIHGASVIWIAIIGLVWLTRYFQNLWIVLFVLSSFVSAMSYISVVDQFSDALPYFMQQELWHYTESDSAMERMAAESQLTYYNFLLALPGYFRLLLGYLLIINRSKINNTDSKKNLFTVYLALSAITGFLSAIPSVGRFMSMVVPFLVIVWIQNADVLKKYNFLFYLVPIIYAYPLLYWFRNMSSVTELYLYILPAPVTFVKYLFMA